MRIRIGSIVILGIAIEAVAIAVLAAAVAIFGPNDSAAAQTYAERLGRWIGPVTSALLCFLAAWWFARRTKSSPILNGTLIGAACAAVDLALLAPLGGKFQLLIALSNGGRIVAGALGAWIASTRSKMG